MEPGLDAQMIEFRVLQWRKFRPDKPSDFRRRFRLEAADPDEIFALFMRHRLSP
ncbi:MAG: hypothetical protein OXT71_05100 [Acidobacteriota bacterium]|nr:hypothetical protein [Acidobacteriota bacterium]